MLPSPAEITALVQSTAIALQPFWPAFAGKAAEALGENVPEAVVKLKDFIAARFEKKETTHDVLLEILKSPEDNDVQAAFRMQLRKVAESDAKFVSELKDLLGAVQPFTSYQQDIKGQGNVGVQGTGNTTTTTTTIHNYTPAEDSQKKTKPNG